jgi:hypothetical protein
LPVPGRNELGAIQELSVIQERCGKIGAIALACGASIPDKKVSK